MIKKVYEFPDMSYAEKKFIADYREREKDAAEAFAEAEKKSVIRTLSFAEEGKFEPDSAAEKIYFAGGDYYVYCEDKKVYKAVKNDSSGTYEFTAGSKVYSEAPHVIAVKKNGKKKILVFGKDGAEIFGESAAVSVPYGKVCAVAGGRLFVASGREIKFSEAFDCVNFSTGTSGAAGVIGVGGDEGEVVCMGAIGDELVILCKRKALVLTATGDISEWKLKRVATEGFSVEEGSAAWCNGKAVFRSGKKLYVFYKSALTAAKSVIDDKNIAFAGSACAFLSVYLLPAESGNEKYIYAYDSATGEEFSLPYYPLLSEKGGAAYDGDNGKVLGLEFDTKVVTAGEGFSPDGTEDFGTADNKLLVRIVLKTTGIGKVKVSGDSDSKIYLLSSGMNVVNVGITSREFKIEYSGFSAGKGAVFAEFVYCVRGY